MSVDSRHDQEHLLLLLARSYGTIIYRVSEGSSGQHAASEGSGPEVVLYTRCSQNIGWERRNSECVYLGWISQTKEPKPKQTLEK